MDPEKKQPPKKEKTLGKPEKMSTPKLPASAAEKADDGEKNADFEIFKDDLEARLDNLFMETEDITALENTGSKPAAALPEKEKGKNDLNVTGAVNSKKGGNIHVKPQSPAPISLDEKKIKEAFQKPGAAVKKKSIVPDSMPRTAAALLQKREPKTDKERKADINQRAVEKKAADIKNVPKTVKEYKKKPIEPVAIDKSSIDKIEIIESFEISDSDKNQYRFYQNGYVLGGILIVLVIVVSFIIFKPFAGVEGDALQNTVTARKIDQAPEQIQIKTVNPSSDTMVAKKNAEPVVQHDTATPQEIPEAKETEPLVEKEKDVLKAPAVSYPYSIHAESYRSLQSAELSAEAYRKTGLQAFWVRVDLGKKGVWYRVFIDCYKDLATAQEIIKEKQLKDANPIKIRYANFIGAYLSDDELTKQRRFLSERGYSPYFIQYENGINYLYTGAFDTLKEAENFSVNLSSRGIRSLVVER